ncbi:bifunctional biotin operon repressor/biotin--[acetyl-CoA-carboxylase] synthetase BirA [Bordetella trematum]|uniref:biotin--[biotin carboxyl-carrier protein] ligase n=1 Tax=Bordetella trematum TaxID=123899 RepID=A0A157RGG5_9BORD|nr:biotin--[acetyl-CoA-carboxylase] ligase [Bordetella trematum]QIM71025.1 biotin--[acetyl-CoA-carboxylase] ligase [Bordetella trematum]SAI57020.1 bifunctional biotin operon repressor/biotin--[acetyl-CoA-carboxylase] synthetase BirA [Bordetella trematum]SAI60808.1 bifunctional biotin operon repressor/biotin--[acetyl-CoA-carboxylase] synthetase BirA [Bordetella trematum]SAI68637.1 bifunctional biotin operon repressor/biotin--[acetyl-CoA-carboxylase] synthetase BirA [Bordetella trematum]SPU48512
MSALPRPASLDLPAPADLARALQDRLPGFTHVQWVESTGSTNADLLARVRQTRTPKPWLLGAHLQEAGRGRAGRPWKNRSGAALMFSCAFDVRLPPAQLPAISPLAGLTACEALRRLSGNDGIGVKWPNDVQWRDAKLAGVLAETTRNPDGDGHTVVIGMGVNLCDAVMLSAALERDIADWTQVDPGAHVSNVADIVQASALAWQQAMSDLESAGFGAFIERYAQADALAARNVNVIDRGTITLSGQAAGVDAFGRLQVLGPQGAVAITAGEISVRAQA